MQEISRHAVHVRENLTVIIDMLEKLHQDQKQVYENLGTGLTRSQWEQIQSHLQLQIQMVKGLKERSISTFKRLKSEIELVSNQG
jgi:hypothetical protein